MIIKLFYVIFLSSFVCFVCAIFGTDSANGLITASCISCAVCGLFLDNNTAENDQLERDKYGK